METQTITIPLDDYDNKSSKFARRKWYIKIMDKMAKEMKMAQPLNFKQKLLNHFCLIILMHIYFCGRKYNSYRGKCRY